MPIENPKIKSETTPAEKLRMPDRKTMARIIFKSLAKQHNKMIELIKRERNPLLRRILLKDEDAHDLIRRSTARRAPYVYSMTESLPEKTLSKAIRGLNQMAKGLIGKDINKFPPEFIGRTPSLIFGTRANEVPWYVGIGTPPTRDDTRSPAVRIVDPKYTTKKIPATYVSVPQQFLDPTTDLLPNLLGHELGHILMSKPVKKTLRFSQHKLSPALATVARYSLYSPFASRLGLAVGAGLGSAATSTGAEVLGEYLANKRFSDFYANRTDVSPADKNKFIQGFKADPTLRGGMRTHLWGTLAEDISRLTSPYIPEGPGNQAPVVTQAKQPGK